MPDINQGFEMCYHDVLVGTGVCVLGLREVGTVFGSQQPKDAISYQRPPLKVGQALS